MSQRKIVPVVSVVGLLLIGGIVGYSYLNNQKESGNIETQIQQQVAEKEQARATTVASMNDSTSAIGLAKEAIRNYINTAEQVKHSDDNIDMAYTYMTESLAQDVKSKYEKASQDVFASLKKEKVDLKVTDIKFVDFKFNNESSTEAVVVVEYTQELIQNNKTISSETYKYKYIVGESGSGAWLLSYYQQL